MEKITKDPKDVLAKILNHVNTRSLLDCRQVNREWNEASTKILSTRPAAEIRIDFGFDQKFRIRTRKYGTKSLKDFVECFKQSENCPFTHFYIRDSGSLDFVRTSTFWDHEDWLQFLSEFDLSKIKGLKLLISAPCEKNALKDFLQKLRDLLFENFSHIEEFGLSFEPRFYDPSQLQTKSFRFRRGAKGKKRSKTSSLSSSSPAAQLPQLKLKVLHLGNSMCSQFPWIVEDLLNSAVNLEQIQLFPDQQNFDMETFHVLHSRGKLELLQVADIRLSEQFISTIGKKWKGGSFVLALRLQEMKLTTEFIQQVNASASNNWATSLGFLSSLDFPTFTSVRELCLIQCRPNPPTSDLLPLQIFPRGVNSRNIFPAVRVLNFDNIHNWKTAFPHKDSIPRLPLVEDLKINRYENDAHTISVLALMCPNLKHLKMAYYRGESTSDFLEIGRAIWTHMTKLESLQVNIEVDMKMARDFFQYCPNLDSCFTGISTTNCQRLYEMSEAHDILSRWKSSVRIPESELKVERISFHFEPEKCPCVDLKELTIKSCSSDPEEKYHLHRIFLNKALSWISRDYAFDYMSHFKLEIIKELKNYAP